MVASGSLVGSGLGLCTVVTAGEVVCSVGVGAAVGCETEIAAAGSAETDVWYEGAGSAVWTVSWCGRSGWCGGDDSVEGVTEPDRAMCPETVVFGVACEISEPSVCWVSG